MNRLTIIGVIIVAVLVFVALFAHWIAPYDISATNLAMRYLPPSSQHWFGTDSTGRDIFSRVVFGARISLQVGLVVVAVSAFIGTLMGAVSVWFNSYKHMVPPGPGHFLPAATHYYPTTEYE